MKKSINRQTSENMEQWWATNTEMQQEQSREEEWAAPEKEKDRERVCVKVADRVCWSDLLLLRQPQLLCQLQKLIGYLAHHTHKL